MSSHHLFIYLFIIRSFFYKNLLEKDKFENENSFIKICLKITDTLHCEIANTSVHLFCNKEILMLRARCLALDA